MGHSPEDENFDEYMNASAENWSKPSEPEPRPEPKAEPTDRWGSPKSAPASAADENRWGSEPIEKTQRENKPKSKQDTSKGKKSGFKWWIIVIIVVVVLCLCACLTFAVLSIFGIVDWNSLIGFDPTHLESVLYL